MKKYKFPIFALLALICLTFTACFIEIDLPPPRGPWGTPPFSTPAPITGRALGYGGLVSITFELVDGYITSVVLDLTSESRAEAARVQANLPGIIESSNSFDFAVNVISRATITTTAVRNAGRQAMIDNVPGVTAADFSN